MSIGIGYFGDTHITTSPVQPVVRQLFTAEDGWLVPESQRPRNWQEIALPKAYVEPVKRPSVVMAAPTVEQRSRSLVARQRVHAEKRRGCPPRKPVTAEMIRPLIEAGHRHEDIARMFNCKPWLIWARMRETGESVARPNRRIDGKAVRVTREEVLQLHSAGKTVVQIAEALGCSDGPVYRRLKEAGVDLAPPVQPVYGWLTVIREVRRYGRKGRVFECRCKCGNLTEAEFKALNAGTRVSCGCKKPEKLTDHPERIALAERLYAEVGTSETARRMGISRTGVYRLVAAAKRAEVGG